MLEGWVASQLQRWLGDYVQPDCFDAARVQLDVWSGYVVLSQLILRPDALDFLGLPVTLRRGSIARVELQIPWGSAAKSNEPTVVTVDKVFLLLETQYDIDSHRHDGFNAAATRSKLEAVEKAQLKARKRASQRFLERKSEKR
jgi:vacuolar protein sorting-associated protein 13A/C